MRATRPIFRNWRGNSRRQLGFASGSECMKIIVRSDFCPTVKGDRLFRHPLSIDRDSVGGVRSDKIMPTDIGDFFIAASQKHPELGIVFQSTYDMHLRPYVDHRTMTGTTPVSVGPVMQSPASISTRLGKRPGSRETDPQSDPVAEVASKIAERQPVGRTCGRDPRHASPGSPSARTPVPG